jgi:hypothetical protein
METLSVFRASADLCIWNIELKLRSVTEETVEKYKMFHEKKGTNRVTPSLHQTYLL